MPISESTCFNLLHRLRGRPHSLFSEGFLASLVQPPFSTSIPRFLGLVGPTNSRTRSSPPLSFNFPHESHVYSQEGRLSSHFAP